MFPAQAVPERGFDTLYCNFSAAEMPMREGAQDTRF